MNDQQKIELAEFISDKHFRLYGQWGNAEIPDSDNIEFTDQVLNKIQELEQKPNSYNEQLRWHRNTLSNCEENPVNNENSASGGENTSSANTEVGQYKTNTDNLHICGVCYQSYPTHVLKTNFQICPDCQHAGRIKIGVQDKNGQLFFSGDVLRAEDSLTTEVQILQIQPGTIVYQTIGFWRCHIVATQDFIDAGWIVHERVTMYEISGPQCITSCKFKNPHNFKNPAKLGSVYCQDCEHNKGFDIKQQWIICEQYNRENEDGK